MTLDFSSSQLNISFCTEPEGQHKTVWHQNRLHSQPVQQLRASAGDGVFPNTWTFILDLHSALCFVLVKVFIFIPEETEIISLILSDKKTSAVTATSSQKPQQISYQSCSSLAFKETPSHAARGSNSTLICPGLFRH